jgi:hypothetical protein
MHSPQVETACSRFSRLMHFGDDCKVMVMLVSGKNLIAVPAFGAIVMRVSSMTLHCSEMWWSFTSLLSFHRSLDAFAIFCGAIFAASCTRDVSQWSHCKIRTLHGKITTSESPNLKAHTAKPVHITKAI